jgi:SAM-dependent methyltransferase
MKDHWESLLEKLDYKEGEKILDVGGAYDPVPISDVVIDCVDLGRGGGQYVLLDLCCHGFPFPDDYFDICICSQTLEDLASPHLAILEMSRVAKRGIIEAPHRGPESLRNDSYNKTKPDCALDEVWHFGVGHHKWLIEELDDMICFTPKVQYLLMKYPIPRWNGPKGVTFKWEGKIPYGLLYDIDESAMELNYWQFRERSQEFWHEDSIVLR